MTENPPINVELLLSKLPGDKPTKRKLLRVKTTRGWVLPETIDFRLAVATAAALLAREPSIRNPARTQKFVLSKFDFSAGQQLIISHKPVFRFDRGVEPSLQTWAILEMDWPIEIATSSVADSEQLRED